MPLQTQRTTTGKALEINLNPQIYGTFAEIGAGQEVARFFFQAGKASQTIAKTISAYDMIYSDEIYGREKSGRYVCESRLIKMLEKEYNLLHKRLSAIRGENTAFFAFANTVATGDQRQKTTHGWMGLRYQKTPGTPFNDIILHIRMLDKLRLQQQEALGILGVNLVAAAYKDLHRTEDFIEALVDNLKEGQVAIDMIRVEGADLAHLNNHLLNLELVKMGLADVILFGPDESILNLSDFTFQRPLIIERGDFRPVTNIHLDLISRAAHKFKVDYPDLTTEPAFLFELTMRSLTDGNAGEVDSHDFLERVRALAKTGSHVLVSNLDLFYQLKQHLRMSTNAPIALLFGAHRIGKIFEHARYQNLNGGLLEALGKLLDPTTRLYIYPHKAKDACETLKTFHPDPNTRLIFEYFHNQGWISELSNCEDLAEYIHSDDVLKMIQNGNPEWKHFVPIAVAELITKDGLFGHKA